MGIPIVKQYTTRTTDALIAPGSSGSGVYNTSGNLVAVVFAGYGRGLSQGILVPWEYIYSFLIH